MCSLKNTQSLLWLSMARHIDVDTIRSLLSFLGTGCKMYHKESHRWSAAEDWGKQMWTRNEEFYCGFHKKETAGGGGWLVWRIWVVWREPGVIRADREWLSARTQQRWLGWTLDMLKTYFLESHFVMCRKQSTLGEASTNTIRGHINMYVCMCACNSYSMSAKQPSYHHFIAFML